VQDDEAMRIGRVREGAVTPGETTEAEVCEDWKVIVDIQVPSGEYQG